MGERRKELNSVLDQFQAQVQLTLYSGVADSNITCDAILETLNG